MLRRTMQLVVPMGVVVLLAGCVEAPKRDRAALERGFEQYGSRQYVLAERAAGEFIAKYPKDPAVDEAFYLRGVSRMARGEKAGAAADLNEAIAKADRADIKAQANRALGEMAFDGGRYEQAIGYYQAALGHYPKERPDSLTLYRLGASLQALGRWDEARPYFARVVALRQDPALVQRAVNRKDLNGYALQFGAFSTEKGAMDYARALRARGVQAVVVREMGDRSLLYLVRAGTYRTFAEADVARSRIYKAYPQVRVSP